MKWLIAGILNIEKNGENPSLKNRKNDAASNPHNSYSIVWPE
jgi:hypothetical protein